MNKCVICSKKFKCSNKNTKCCSMVCLVKYFNKDKIHKRIKNCVGCNNTFVKYSNLKYCEECRKQKKTYFNYCNLCGDIFKTKFKLKKICVRCR
jgi:hypothetical protein